MTISICVGSSCHIKGSYKIIELLTKAIEENNLQNDVELKAAFCLGKCTNGVSVSVDDKIICGINEDNFDEFFKKEILKQ